MLRSAAMASADETLFPAVSPELDFPAEELRTLAFWKERGIFEKTLRAREASPLGTFVFYEGPPTANGMPHNGHALTRAIKDLFPRYKTMRGFSVPRKAGWDTHGLPVEVEVEKELGIHGKKAIEEYGIEPFTEKCIASVFRYTEEWERNTERIGFWVDLKDAYVTFHRDYVESVWWALKTLFDKSLLYRGHKVVWWWAQGGTALSAAEVGSGYKTVDDPSVYVAFPLVGDAEGHALLAWTTTPWTLPSNSYAAVNPEFEYVYATLGDRKVVMAAALLEAFAKKLKVDATIERRVTGRELVGLAYEPPFDLYKGVGGPVSPYFKVIAGRLRHARCGHGGRPHRACVRRGRLSCAPWRARRARRSERAALALRRAARRHLRTRTRALRRQMGQGVRRRDHQRAKGQGADRLSGAVPPRVPLLLALRRRPAHPVRSPGVVHPHARQQRARAGEQPSGRLEAGEYPRRAHGRVPGQQRRLGAVARALLGHGAPRMGKPGAARGRPRALRRHRQRRRATRASGLEPRGDRARGGEGHPRCGAGEAPTRAQTVDRPRGFHPTRRRGRIPARARGDRRVVRLGVHAVRAVGVSARRGKRRDVSFALPGRLHQRGDRSDARLVLFAADGLDAALRRRGAEEVRAARGREPAASLQDVHRARSRRRQGRQEGVEIEGQLHASRGHPRQGAYRARGGRRGDARRGEHQGREGATGGSVRLARRPRRARPTGRGEGRDLHVVGRPASRDDSCDRSRASRRAKARKRCGDAWRCLPTKIGRHSAPSSTRAR